MLIETHYTSYWKFEMKSNFKPLLPLVTTWFFQIFLLPNSSWTWKWTTPTSLWFFLWLFRDYILIFKRFLKLRHFFLKVLKVLHLFLKFLFRWPYPLPMLMFFPLVYNLLSCQWNRYTNQCFVLNMYDIFVP